VGVIEVGQPGRPAPCVVLAKHGWSTPSDRTRWHQRNQIEQDFRRAETVQIFTALEGDSEKQVALRMGLSRHTVHEYVTELYRRLDVGRRPELMALCLRHRPPARP
jgi:DNA-binding CsgD family transcriptional regulator